MRRAAEPARRIRGFALFMRPRPPRPATAKPRRLPVALAVALPILLAGCVGVLDPLGPVGRNDSTILIDATLIMLAVVVPTILLAFWMAWRYRASNAKAEYLPN